MCSSQKRRAGEADEHGVRHDGLHHPMQFATLGSVALIHKYEQVAFGLKVTGEIGLKLSNVLVSFWIDGEQTDAIARRFGKSQSAVREARRRVLRFF